MSLSEQNLMDCDKKCASCDGGIMFSAFNYIKKNKGIDTEESYPYEAVCNILFLMHFHKIRKHAK